MGAYSQADRLLTGRGRADRTGLDYLTPGMGYKDIGQDDDSRSQLSSSITDF
ncbi:uncharacterized protein MELLADRAFT_73000 [Melampsora larici-populina 98AG31]|uniref:Uncharacterized protein n=1 Tax=Melampsora larici-populina (strain 98AG31 / pathotype 3-4-7) TaxID=747676 RepID=F4S1U4_MELLP|nr:uncharacterized protein MELLADRAFT_73000 [Melampsora larici-populina 98AG31]EGG01438.1 hypothetical protein MELLADRAFT_73000 [Melampsora larici-populina 98AG31]